MIATALPPSLEALAAQFHSTMESARKLAESRTNEQANWKPPGGGWSIAECIDHLARTNAAYLDSIEQQLDAASSDVLTAGSRMRCGLFARWFAKKLEPPVRRRIPAPADLHPDASSIPAERVLDKLADTHRRFALVLFRARNADTSRIRLASPVSRFLRMNLYEAMMLLAAHERRHLWQATNVSRSDSFPA